MEMELFVKFLTLKNENTNVLMEFMKNEREKRKLRLKYLKCVKEMRACIQQYYMLANAAASLSSGHKLLWKKWKKPRTKCFWEVDCQVNDDDFFRNNFRMDRASFGVLCHLLKGLEKKETNMRKAIPLRKRVAVALYALGSSAEYRTIANMFGIGKSTVCTIVIEFCEEVWKILRPMYMNSFPLTAEKINENVAGFKKMGLPQCFGAIDGCHVEIHPRAEDAVDYFNYKGWYSTVLLALVDHRYRFVYINVGSPGRCNDSQIFEKSLLKRELTECRYMTEMSTVLSNVVVPVYIIGDSAFKLATNLMKPYPYGTEQSLREKNFNYIHSKCRRVVENGFGQLKARFRRIGKGIDNNIDNANIILKACCVLHNFLNERNEIINRTWMQEQQNIDRTREAPDQISILHDNDVQANEIRSAITDHLTELDADEVMVDELSELIWDASGNSTGDNERGEDANIDGPHSMV